ncbi:MAG: endonuclease domain-containing protein [FCB group bacterium]|nr:endonuclease domain-containing protein [FCB group bacterium]
MSYKRVVKNGSIRWESNQFIELAREFRKSSTPVEVLLWEQLRNKKLDGHKFCRQHPIEGYIVDFYHRKLKLAVELDGEIHKRAEISEKDKSRTAHLAEHGISVIRFKNDEIERDIESVLKQILQKLCSLQA